LAIVAVVVVVVAAVVMVMVVDGGVVVVVVVVAGGVVVVVVAVCVLAVVVAVVAPGLTGRVCAQTAGTLIQWGDTSGGQVAGLPAWMWPSVLLIAPSPWPARP
jgi:hypothetical protein